MLNPPPKFIPNELINDFTLDGIIPISYECYRDDSREEIQKEINSNFNKETFEKFLVMAKNRKENYYGATDSWLYQALDKYPISDKNVCIFGSACPWYEAIAVTFGAKKCTVIEYSDRPSFHESIEYKKNDDLIDGEFSVGFSISSFEHYGLGRYGDPINPIGDLEIMQKAKKIISKNGLLFLGIPIGKDFLHFNVGRIYGMTRILLLMEEWKLIESFGLFSDAFNVEINTCKHNRYQPIFVLKNI